MTSQCDQSLSELSMQELADGIAKLNELRKVLLKDAAPGLNERRMQAVLEIKKAVDYAYIDGILEAIRRKNVAKRRI